MFYFNNENENLKKLIKKLMFIIWLLVFLIKMEIVFDLF